MILGNPDEKDFHFHAICLHSLLAIGHSLILLGEEFEQKEFEHTCVEHAHIEAYVQELEQSFREWHHGFSSQEVAAVEEKIFGGEA